MKADPTRPARLVADAAHDFPAAWRLADELRADREGLPAWPEWCFLPIAGWLAIAERQLGPSAGIDEMLLSASMLAALGAWRVGQGVYRFDPDLFDALVETPVRGALPEVLLRLPEWGVYVETPGLTVGGEALAGFFAHLEWDVNRHIAELRFLLDADRGGRPSLTALTVPLIGDLPSALEYTARSAREAARHGLGINFDFDPQATAREVEPLVSLVLYLCSERPDVSGTWPPARPQPKRTRKGVRLFPPKAPRPWVVGAGIGAALRRAQTAEDQKSVGTESRKADRHRPRPHIRRAHWHTYRVGKGRRDAKLRWLSPMLVGACGEGDLPVTVHPVKETEDE